MKEEQEQVKKRDTQKQTPPKKCNFWQEEDWILNM